MKGIKRLSIALVALLVFIFTISYVNSANAATNVSTNASLTVDGVSVRTTVKPGIRFVMNVNDFDCTDVVEYGMVMIIGETEATDEFVVDGTVNGSKVLRGFKKELNSDGKTYYVTVYGFSESLYVSTISARAFVQLSDGTRIYGTNVTQRSLGEVALKAINNGQSTIDAYGDPNIVGQVESALTSAETDKGYMKIGMDAFGDFTISNLYEGDPTRIRDMFIEDYNNYVTNLGSTDTIAADSSYLDFYLATAPKQMIDGVVASNNTNTDITTSNLYQFFQTERWKNKYSWILDMFMADKANFNFTVRQYIEKQVTAIKNGWDDDSTNDGKETVILEKPNLYNMQHLLLSMYSFFYAFANLGDYEEAKSYDHITYGTKESCANLSVYNNKIYSDISNYDLVKIGDEIALPDLSGDTQSNTGYLNGDSTVNVGDKITITQNGGSYTPTYKEIAETFTITYMNGNNIIEELNSTYTEEAAVTLPKYSLTGYIFEGWYENSDLSGNVVAEIPLGSTGNKVFYAKLTEVGKQFAVDDDWTSMANGTKVTLNGMTYTFGTDAFATIADADDAVAALNSTNVVVVNVAAGTYSTAFTVDASNIKFVGPNAGLHGENSSRSAEANITGCIYLKAGTGNIEFNGFGMSGSCKIWEQSGSATSGTSQAAFAKRVDGFTFTNNKVTSSNLYGFMIIGRDSSSTYPAYSYSHNFVFTNNYFEEVVSTNTTFMVISAVRDLVMNNNTFKNIKKTAIYITDGDTTGNKGLSGHKSEFNNNTFDTIGTNAIQITWFAHIKDTTISEEPSIEINGNTFRDVAGICVSLGKGNSGDAYGAISVSDNTFDNSFGTGIYFERYYAGYNAAINGNLFNAIPSSMYINFVTSNGSTIYALGNTYWNGGTKIETVDSTKFTSNIIYEPQPITITEMGGNGVVKVGQSVTYKANYAGATWKSSDESIAIVDVNGKITGVSKGAAVITVSYEGASFQTGITVYDDTTSALMQLLMNNNSGILKNQDITYHGFVSGYEKMVHNIYDSANNYWPGTITIDSTSYKLSSSDGNYGVAMTPKYITVHDSGSTTTNAKQTAAYCVNSSNTSSSWHYSTGTDGVYQSIPDTITAGHAGDGSRRAGFTKTQVKGTPGSTVQLVVTVSGGYFYLGGQYTGVAAPTTATTKVPSIGIYHYVGSDGYYYLANTYYNTTYKTISMMGGNRDSIGIESSVKYGTDVYLTWQITAKLVSQLLVKWNLNTERVRQHNNFSGKDCPMTMRGAGWWPDFMEIVEVDYEVRKNYSNWTIKFDSSHESYLYNNGRIENRPERTVGTSYKITVTSPAGKTETAELYVIIPGHTNNVMNKW